MLMRSTRDELHRVRCNFTELSQRRTDGGRAANGHDDGRAISGNIRNGSIQCVLTETRKLYNLKLGAYNIIL